MAYKPDMRVFEKISLILHILRWRFSWGKRDLGYQAPGVSSEKFITARAAARLIPDGSVVFSSGFAGNARCSVFFWAIREAFEREGRPKGLTWINVGAQGGRGKVPGTAEELGLPGLLRRYITGHVETTKAQLRMAAAGQLELHVLPQGIMTFLLEAQAHGQSTVVSATGRGTFLDPQVGSGSAVTANPSAQYIRAADDGLEYTLPKIDFALFNAPWADADGNIYFHNASCISENTMGAAAARANGGKVIATVAGIIPSDPQRISMPAADVDHIVVHPLNEQAASVRQVRYWPAFTTGAKVDRVRAAQRLRFINTFLKITPVRSRTDDALTRMAAWLFTRVAHPGSVVNIGVGYPEEVARHLVEQGLGEDLVFTTEAGVYGGLPGTGIFFGAALGPEKMISSTEMFRFYRDHLDVTVLGFLQVDGAGNVNASKRGAGLEDFVGPGGFPDIAAAARTIIFVGSWQAHAGYRLEEGRLTLARPGQPKFVEAVDQITFNAREAYDQGKNVYYVTHVGIFRLTAAGLELAWTVPGIDPETEVRATTAASIHLPAENLPEIDRKVLSGIGWMPAWRP